MKLDFKRALIIAVAVLFALEVTTICYPNITIAFAVLMFALAFAAYLYSSISLSMFIDRQYPDQFSGYKGGSSFLGVSIITPNIMEELKKEHEDKDLLNRIRLYKTSLTIVLLSFLNFVLLSLSMVIR